MTDKPKINLPLIHIFKLESGEEVRFVNEKDYRKLEAEKAELLECLRELVKRGTEYPSLYERHMIGQAHELLNKHKTNSEVEGG